MKENNSNKNKYTCEATLLSTTTLSLSLSQREATTEKTHNQTHTWFRFDNSVGHCCCMFTSFFIV